MLLALVLDYLLALALPLVLNALSLSPRIPLSLSPATSTTMLLALVLEYH